MKTESWEAKLADSINGILFLGARKRGRGPWLKIGDLPGSVKSYLNLEVLPGAAGNVILGDFKSQRLEDLERILEGSKTDRFTWRRGNQALVWFDVNVEERRRKRKIPRGVPAIRNLQDLMDHFGVEEVTGLNRRIYKDTDCGASISIQTPDEVWHHNGEDWSGIDEVVAFTIQTIVEGSDAEVNSDPFELPVTVAEVDDWIKEMEEEADQLWKEANRLEKKQDWDPEGGS